MPIAAIQDWLQLLVPLAFFLYAIIQLLSAKAGPQARKPPQRKPEQAERPLRPAPQAPLPGSPQAQLNAEIEQFLRRAGERRERSRPPSASPPKPPQAPRPAAPVGAERRPRSEKRPGAPPPPEPRRREISTVAAEVEQYMGQRGFAQRTEHLADDIVKADAQMEEHLKQAFSRKVGTLDDASPAAAGPVTDVAPAIQAASPAESFAGMLANPQNVRQAIILTEILARPEHRW